LQIAKAGVAPKARTVRDDARTRVRIMDMWGSPLMDRLIAVLERRWAPRTELRLNDRFRETAPDLAADQFERQR